MSGSGDLSITAQPRYAFVAQLLREDFPPPAKVVELGSAPGDQIAAIARLGYTATSVDLGASEDGWASGEKGRFRRLLAEAGIDHITWDLETVPYPLPDETFDAVIMTEVFEHLRDYPIGALQESRRILRPGGRLYLTTPNSAYLMNRARLVAGRTVHTALPDWIAGLPHARHAREYTFGEMVELMRHAELEIVSRQSRHFHRGSGRTSIGARVAKSMLNQVAKRRMTLGPSIIIVAERTSPS